MLEILVGHRTFELADTFAQTLQFISFGLFFHTHHFGHYRIFAKLLHPLVDRAAAAYLVVHAGLMHPAETTCLNFANHLLLERLAVTHYYFLFHLSVFRSKTDNLFQDATS